MELKLQHILTILIILFIIEIILVYTLQIIGVIFAIIIALTSMRLITEYTTKSLTLPDIWLIYAQRLIPLNITQTELEKEEKTKAKKHIEKEIKRILGIKGTITQINTTIKPHGIIETIKYKTKRQEIILKILYTTTPQELLQEEQE
jgi:hypothetical protein